MRRVVAENSSISDPSCNDPSAACFPIARQNAPNRKHTEVKAKKSVRAS